MEKSEFIWDLDQQNSFQYIKNTISNNIISEADLKVQYHGVNDVSK